MKKLILMSALGLSSQMSIADDINQSLVGKWACESVVQNMDVTIQTKNNLTYHPTGKASEDIHVKYYINNQLQMTSDVKLQYDWVLSDGRQEVSNMTVSRYDSYDYASRKNLTPSQTKKAKEDLLMQYRQNPWQNIVFLDNNTHRFSFDDGITGICKREF